MNLKDFRLRLILLTAISAHARGEVVFSQLYPPNIYNVSYQGGSAFNVSGSSAISNGYPIGFQSVAAQFTLQADAVVTSFDLALTYLPQSSRHDVLIKLEGNDATNGIPNGNVLTSAVVTTNVAFNSSDSVLTSFLPTGGSITLLGGKTYWLVAIPTDPLDDVGWNTLSKSSTYSVCSFANSPDGTNFSPRYSYDWPAFQVVSSSSVPEPASIALFAFTAAPFLLLRRLRN